MKIAKSTLTDVQITSQGIVNNYYAVPDNHVFSDDEDDVTTIESLRILSTVGVFDYGVFRDSLSSNIVPNWADLTFDDKRNCAKHYRYPSDISQDEWLTYFTEVEHEANWNETVSRTRDDVRLQRLFAAFQKVSYRLTQGQVATVYMTTKNMCYDYYYANLPHLILWITNGAYPAMGINYTNNGFAQMSGYTQSLMLELVDIINNGNYKKV